MRGVLGGTRFRHADWIGKYLLEAHHVRGFSVFLLPSFDVDKVIHELAHVLDNRLGFSWPIGSALFGGGPADQMSRYLGADPTQCWNRSRCSGYEVIDPPSEYARNGPSEDFAESFKLSVRGELTGDRALWFLSLGDTLNVVQSEYTGSPYHSRRYVAPPVPNSPIGSSGGGWNRGSPLFQ